MQQNIVNILDATDDPVVSVITIQTRDHFATSTPNYVLWLPFYWRHNKNAALTILFTSSMTLCLSHSDSCL